MTNVVVVTRIAAPPSRVFDLELDVDVHAASFPSHRETATTSSGARVLGPGDEVTFRARHLGVVWTLTSRITSFDRPRRFVDEQVHGPFARMRHERVFGDDGAGGTVMTDRMTLVAPLGLLGRPFEVVLATRLRRLLRQRARVVRQLAERDRR